MRHRAGAAGAVLLGHPRHFVLFAAVAGLLLGSSSRAVPVGAAALVAAIALAAGALCAPARGLGPAVRVPAVALGLAGALAVVGGAAVAELRLQATSGDRLAALSGRPVNVTATVLEPVRERAAGPAVARVRIGSLEGGASEGSLVGELSSEGSLEDEVSEGSLEGEVAVMRVRPSAHAGGWPGVGELVDLAGRVAPLGRYDAYQRPRGAGAAIDVDALRRTGRRRGGIAGALDAVRRRAERGLERGLHRREADLLRGMVLGQDERLDEEVRTDFQRSGLAHLLAVSGQNVMLLAILVLVVAGVAGVPLRARLVLALALVAAYVPLAGGGPSIQRAGVMGAAGLVAALAGRPASRWYALGLAAVTTLALNPRAASEPGWQLSFAAVLSLLVLCPRLRDVLERIVPRPVAEAAAMTVAATAGTAPLLAMHFGAVSLASLPANLLAAPAVAPIMWLGMLATAAAQISPALSAPLNALDGPLLAYLAWLARAAGEPESAVLSLRPGPGLALALTILVPCACLVALRALAGRLPPARASRPLPRSRRVLLVTAAAVAGALLLAPRVVEPGFRAGPGELVVSFLDVGQGDATLIQDGSGASVLFDGGPPEARVQRALRSAGVQRLDLVVATHKSRDHHGGLHAVLERVPTRLLLENGDGTGDPDFRRLLARADARGIRRLEARAGQVLRVGGLVIEILSPAPLPPDVPPPEEPNPRGVAAIVSAGALDLWLSADAESDAILPLKLRPVEVMKVSHHGSADPGLAQVLERLRPQIAAIEVGTGNTYGHPAPTTLAALDAAVPHVYRTDRDGTVIVRVADGRMGVSKER